MRLNNKIADSNEPGNIVNKLLELDWIRKRLYSGDYSFFSCHGLSVGITRKTISDLLSSINNNFGDQLAKMREVYDIKIILLEGKLNQSHTIQRLEQLHIYYQKPIHTGAIHNKKEE